MAVVHETITVTEERKHLSYYIRQANAGRTFLITVRGEPVARLVPYKWPRRHRPRKRRGYPN